MRIKARDEMSHNIALLSPGASLLTRQALDTEKAKEQRVLSLNDKIPKTIIWLLKQSTVVLGGIKVSLSIPLIS